MAREHVPSPHFTDLEGPAKKGAKKKKKAAKP